MDFAVAIVLLLIPDGPFTRWFSWNPADVKGLRTQPSALRWMERREEAPRYEDPTELPGGSKLGRFWTNCKSLRWCGRPPYNRLLANLFLKADYNIIASGTTEL